MLPAKFPNLLVNGAGGIAVGMATNIPPHNLTEIIDATIALIENPAIDDVTLLDIVPGPDFPTGGADHRPRRIAQWPDDGARLRHHALEDRDRDDEGRPRGHHHHRGSLPGEQGDDGREDRRAGSREEDRRHCRPARRKRPQRHSRRHRDQAGFVRRHRAEQPVPPDADADLVRRQHAGAEWRPAGTDDAARRCCRPSSASARKWSRAAPSSS